MIDLFSNKMPEANDVTYMKLDCEKNQTTYYASLSLNQNN